MKTEEIGAFDAKTHLSALLKRVEQGARFYITRHGKRIAELRPVAQQTAKRKAGFMKGLIVYMAPDFDAPLDDLKDYTE